MTTEQTPSRGPRRPADVPLPERLKHLPVDERGYPIIVTIPQTPGDIDFGAISERRKLIVATYDLCAVCGHPFAEDDLRWQVTFAKPEEAEAIGSSRQTAHHNEGPVHMICALYAAQVCPFVSSPYARLSDQMRRGQRRGEALVLRGYRTTAAVEAISSELQAGVNILMFSMADLVQTIVLRNAGEAQEAYRLALEQDAMAELDPATATLVHQLSTPLDDGEDSAGVMVGGAYTIGAAFLDGISEVQGMSSFNRDSSYFRIAVTIAEDTEALEWRSMRDPHMLAALDWLSTRKTAPALLDRWRTRGRSRYRIERGPVDASRDGRSRPLAPRRDNSSAKRRKAQRAARRKNR